MKLTSRHWLWLGLAVVALLSGLWSWRPMDKSAGRLAILPLEGFGFSSRDLPLNQTEIQTYRQAEAIKRLYQTKGQRFILTAVDGSRNRHAVHDPLYCFRGDGWQVLRQQLVTVPGGHAKLLTLMMSLREIRRNTMRSVLTTLGVIIGVAAVIAMVHLGQGATLRITNDISSLGRNLLFVFPGSGRRPAVSRGGGPRRPRPGRA